MEGLVADSDFWNGKNVLITGHTGFKGGWLSIWLSSMGAQVTGIALEPETSPNLFSSAGVSKLVDSLTLDIRNKDALVKSFASSQPEVVFHLAAQALVRRSYLDPVGTYEVNVLGTLNVLEAVRQTSSVKSVVIVTTDKCYENREWEWGYRENEPMGGHDPYSSSKGCAELLVASYRSSFFSSKESPSIATVRAGNVFGGGDWSEDRLIPDLCRSIMSETSVVLRNPSAVRPWQHVLDPLNGYLLLAEALSTNGEVYAQAWNFGPKDEDAKTVEWVVKETIKNWGVGSYEVDSSEQLHEAQYLKLDCSKARQRLGWSPLLGIEEGIEYTIKWYKAHYANERMAELCVFQIDQYTKNRTNLSRTIKENSNG